MRTVGNGQAVAFFPLLAAVVMLVVGIRLGSNSVCRGGSVGTNSIRAMNVISPAPVDTFAGIHIAIKGHRHSLNVTAITTNQGKDTATIFRSTGDFVESGLMMFDPKGRKLKYTNAFQKKLWRPRVLRSTDLGPGKAIKKTFTIDRYYKFARRGVFYLYVAELVAKGKGKGSSVPAKQKFVRSPILKLTLRQGRPPEWRVVPAVPKPGPRRTQLAVPPFPKYNIPAGGPVATLDGISTAVRAHDLKRVKQLCYHGASGPEPFIVANAREAIAISNFCKAMQNKFGINPEKHLTLTHPTPESFSYLVKELNVRSLKINGDDASVGILYFKGKKFAPMPNFAFCFRKVRGHWLLDSGATYKHLSQSRGQYRLAIEKSIRETHVFDSLTRQLAAGRFAALKDFTAVAARRLAAVNDWFMLQSMKNNKRWMKNNAQWVKRIKGEEKPAATQPSKTQH